MSPSLSLARPDDDKAPAQVSLAREDDAEDPQRKVLRLIGEGQRVLAVGRTSPALSRGLKLQSCDVVTATEAVPAESDATRLRLPDGVGDDTFDVVVAANALEYASDPVAFLRAARRHLRAEGYLVVRVPNVAHGSVRLALLGGRFPFGEPGTDDAAPVRFFTYDSLVAVVEKAGFAIGAVEREEEDFGEPSGSPAGATADVIDAVAADADARTAQFVIAAYPVPSPKLGWLHDRMRGLAEQLAAARRDADELRSDLDAVNSHVRMLVEQQEASLRREKELKAKVLDGHDRLAARDEEYRAATAANEASLKRVQEDAAARERDLHGRLAQAEAELAHARHHAHQMAAHAAAVEARLDRFRRSLPGRLYRAVRGLVKRG